MIDLSQLPAPDIVAALDYETILAALQDDAVARLPGLAGTISLESEPVNVLLQAFAYRELQLRARINAAARACMLAYATGSDLEHLAALYGVQRLTIAPGDPDAVPPAPATLESDAALRARVQLAPEGFGSAGPVAAYQFHTRAASGEVLDAAVHPHTPEAGTVTVTVLGTMGDGTPSAAVLAAVAAMLNAETVRPLGDLVVVQPATIKPYVIEAELVLYPGPSSAMVLAAARAAVEAYTVQTHRLGHDVTPSGLYAALHQPSVQRVTLITPAGGVQCAAHEAPYCTGLTLTVAASTDV